MTPRATARVLAALAGPTLLVSALGAGCEPQEIYLFDRPPVTTNVDLDPDAGPTLIPSRPAPAPSEPPPADAGPQLPPEPLPEVPDDSVVEEPPREQPRCLTATCEDCVSSSACAVDGTLLFCHVVTGECALPCDGDAPADQPGNCPAAERCDSRIGLCVECVQDADCYGALICDRRTGTCEQCVNDADCAGGLVCAQGSRRCVQCQSDADCAGRDDDIHCLTSEQRCVECVSDRDCTEPDKPFCSSERECDDD